MGKILFRLSPLLFLLFITGSILIWRQVSTPKFKTTSQKQLSLGDFYLQAQKDKALQEVVEGEVFYIVEVKDLGDNRYQLDYSLRGTETMKVDAADLILLLSKNLTLEKWEVGPAFPNYPRRVVEGQKIIITGAASIKGNKVILGEVNKTMLSLVIKKNIPSQTASVIIDTENSQAYLKGQSVSRHDKSITRVEF